MNYRTKINAATITIASDGNYESDILVHTACALANPSIHMWEKNYEFENGERCAICAIDLLYFPDLRWSEEARQIMGILEKERPGGRWEEKYVYLDSGVRAANVYYAPQRDAIAVLYPDASTTIDFDS